MTEKELARLLSDAKKDKPLKEKLIATRGTENPVEDFCALSRSLGYEITAGELFALGLTQNDAKLRSVNGGGVNPIEGWDDAYEQFFTELIWT
ncbi:Nitrogen fixation protein of unknown function [Ruminococcaceae bacterium P7]|nr:Nitrogen fixation protein of unknown function [Ruminococcaceae bacterium P7]